MVSFTRLGIAIVAGSLWIGAEARAQIVLDSFQLSTGSVVATAGFPQSTFTPVTIDGSPASRRLSVAATDSADVQSNINGDGDWGANVIGIGIGTGTGEITLDYTLLDLDLGPNVFLEVTIRDLIADSSPPLLNVSLTNSSAGITLTGATALTSTVTGYNVFFDVRTLSGYSPAFLNGVNEVELVISGPPTFSFGVSAVQFTPVPEPSVALLLGAAALGALLLRRRIPTEGEV